jgi:hypothetical protein
MVAFVTKRRETREARGGLCIDEDEASFFFRQLVWAVQFCHKNHVAHRWAFRILVVSLFVGPLASCFIGTYSCVPTRMRRAYSSGS